jgi:hypothetical protein
MILIPIRTRGSNAREHWQARHRRVKGERLHTGRALLGQSRPEIPCTVILTRLSSGTLDEGDNLPAALKGVRDQIAAWLGIDDRHSDQVRYEYRQRRVPRGQYGVEVEFGPAVSGAQFVLGVESREPA